MDHRTYLNLRALFEKGKLIELEKLLQPFLEKSDLDARFLKTHFTVDTNESDEEVDARQTQEMMDLSRLLYPKALYVMAWKYHHGDDVERNRSRFLLLLSLSALLGYKQASLDLSKEVELEMDWEGIENRINNLLETTS